MQEKNTKYKELNSKPLASFFILHSSFRGFTLLEAVITIAIIGILSGIGIVSLTSSRNQAKLKSAQTEVAATIKLAQSYALQGKNCDGNMPSSYKFHIRNNKDYSIRCNDSIDVENYSLSGGVTLAPVGGFISFDVPNANTNIPLGTSINFQSGSAIGTISINSHGGVTIN